MTDAHPVMLESVPLPFAARDETEIDPGSVAKVRKRLADQLANRPVKSVGETGNAVLPTQVVFQRLDNWRAKMLPPIPAGVIQVTAQQDVVKPRPDVPPVTPVQSGANESSVGLDRRHPQEAEEMLRDEQRRRQRRGYTPEELSEGETDEQDQAALDELPRQGLWVDVKV